MAYVTDTHPLLWYISDDERLIVLAECLYAMEREKIPMTFREMIERIENSQNYIVVSADLNVIKVTEKLSDLPELHDRMIVATAKLLNSDLITKDSKITRSGYVRTVW